MDRILTMKEKIAEKPNNDHFHLHVHEWYEIIYFLEVDAKYIIEGKFFSLKPGDVIVIRRNQMHRVFHNSSKRYRRFIFSVHSEFFETCGCKEYEADFLCAKNNKIDAAIVQASGLQDAFLRAQKYSNNFTDWDSLIARTIMIEILYLMNQVTTFSEGRTINKQLTDVINYISENFTQNITLDELVERFFISKYHLCRSFTKATGLTVYQYITKKRLLYAKELVAEGKHIGEAASLSGFNTYSSFYRAYIKEYGVPPGQSRNIHNNHS